MVIADTVRAFTFVMGQMARADAGGSASRDAQPLQIKAPPQTLPVVTSLAERPDRRGALDTMKNPSILFVCLGNICRSPLVEGVARQRFAQAGLDVSLASCGTGSWHVGKGADARMVRAAANAGYDLSPHRARQVRTGDFRDFDWVLAMDKDNLDSLESLRRGQGVAPMLFLPWAGVGRPGEFPDPYYGDAEGFSYSVALAEQGVDGLIARLRRG